MSFIVRKENHKKLPGRPSWVVVDKEYDLIWDVYAAEADAIAEADKMNAADANIRSTT